MSLAVPAPPPNSRRATTCSPSSQRTTRARRMRARESSASFALASLLRRPAASRHSTPARYRAAARGRVLGAGGPRPGDRGQDEDAARAAARPARQAGVAGHVGGGAALVLSLNRWTQQLQGQGSVQNAKSCLSESQDSCFLGRAAADS